MIEITIIFCVLLLLAYLFDITFSKTKIPTVILLLALGFGVRQITNYWEIKMPDLGSLLPLLGNIGLILIVLEGSLELEIHRYKAKRISVSFAMALLPMLGFTLIGAWILKSYFQVTFIDAMINLIPLGIISSAISIPSSQNLCPKNKEFVTYEGSFSDTLGVLFFNMLLLRKITETSIVGRFSLMLIGVIVLSLVSTVLLAYLMQIIKHRVKYVPIIVLAILMFSIGEYFHMPGLIFIMLFGIFLENSAKLKDIKILSKIHPEKLAIEVVKFKELTFEASFLVRSVFFLLFGYLLETSELLDSKSMVWTVAIVASIFVIRYIHLKIFKIDILPLLFMAPRGLVTIVLFLSIPVQDKIPFINQSVVIQTIVITGLIMMIELVSSREPNKTYKIKHNK